MTEQELFKKSANQLKAGAGLLDTRIKELEKHGKSLTELEKVGELATVIFVIYSLKLWIKVINFIARKVVLIDNDEHYFALSSIRTLTDIFSRIVCLLEQTEVNRAKMCILYMLYTSTKINDEIYQEGLSVYGEYLNLKELKVPCKANEFDWKWYKNSGHTFDGNNKILTESILKKYTIETGAVFSNKHTYIIFTHLSEMLHGNPVYHSEPHNERFWLATMSISLTANIIEIIDRYFLDKVKAADFRIWFKDIISLKKPFLAIWPGQAQNKS